MCKDQAYKTQSQVPNKLPGQVVTNWSLSTDFKCHVEENRPMNFVTFQLFRSRMKIESKNFSQPGNDGETFQWHSNIWANFLRRQLACAVNQGA